MDSSINSNLSEIKALMKKHGVIKASLFGSAVTKNITEANDVDFIVSFDPNLNYTEYGDNYFQLLYALQHLLKKEVDIIAEENITNPYLLQNINSQKVSVL